MKKAFTLVEMMFVMTIIALLFILSVPNIQRVLNIVNEKGCEAQLKVVDAAILQYQLLYQEIPSSIDDLVNEDLLSQEQTTCQNQKIIDIQEGEAYVD